MTSYLDTSFLASLYAEDVNTAAAINEFKNSDFDWVLTEFNLFEMANAFAGRVFRRELSSAEAAGCLTAFREDISNGIIHVLPIPEDTFARATILAEKQTARLGTRSLDVLHVAIAAGLHALSFHTFDTRQAKLARAAGLTVRPRPH